MQHKQKLNRMKNVIGWHSVKFAAKEVARNGGTLELFWQSLQKWTEARNISISNTKAGGTINYMYELFSFSSSGAKSPACQTMPLPVRYIHSL